MPTSSNNSSNTPKPIDLEQLAGWDEHFSPEELAIRNSVRQWVREEYLPQLVEHHRQGTFDKDVLPRLGQLGVMGANLKGYGCADLNNVAYGLIMQELEAADSGLRSVCSVQGALVMWPIFQFGTEAQRQRWLPDLAAGKTLGSFGLTEPSAGSDPAAMATRARKTSEGYVLNGVKAWITSAPLCDLAVVWAKVEDEDNTIAGFVVERSDAGFSTVDIEGKWSLRASPTGELHFNDCVLPADRRLEGVRGLKGPLSCLSQARYGIAWGAMGAAAQCFEVARDYGIERQAFGRPLAQTQLYQNKLAEMASAIVEMQICNLHYGRLKDQGKLTPIQISLMKRQSLSRARKIAAEARTMLGANGISDAYPVMRHMMNLESVYTYEGTHEVHTLALGRALTGLNAF